MKQPPRILPQLTYSDLTSSTLLRTITEEGDEDYYWSDDFSAKFYAAQARAGFMAVTERHKGSELLLPELQYRYAILDFDDLHISRKVQRILRRNPPSLHVGLGLQTAYEGIHAHHPRSWLTPRYLRTLEAVNALSGDVHIVSVLLRHEGEITAGEIGYILGRTYTSLSGFSSRDPRYRNQGTTQLVLLGQWLQQHRFAFWNLGQPYMAYKFSLGAKVYSRQDFLTRWRSAIAQSLS